MASLELHIDRLRKALHNISALALRFFTDPFAQIPRAKLPPACSLKRFTNQHVQTSVTKVPDQSSTNDLQFHIVCNVHAAIVCNGYSPPRLISGPISIAYICPPRKPSVFIRFENVKRVIRFV